MGKKVQGKKAQKKGAKGKYEDTPERRELLAKFALQPTLAAFVYPCRGVE